MQGLEALERSAHRLTNNLQVALSSLEMGQADKALEGVRTAISELHLLTLEIAARTVHCSNCVELNRVAAKLAAKLAAELKP